MVTLWSNTSGFELWLELNLGISFQLLYSLKLFVILLGLTLSACALALGIAALVLSRAAKPAAILGIIASPISGLALLLLALSLTGTPSSYEYVGDNVDLSTEARNSILGADQGWESSIVVVDEDNYGRKMFVFRGTSIAADEVDQYAGYKYLYGVLISQQSDREYVYYYEDYNFLIYSQSDCAEIIPRSPSNSELAELVDYPGFQEDIATLKDENDWGKPLNENKFFKVRISRGDKDKDTQGGLAPEQSKDAIVAYIESQANYQNDSPGYTIASSMSYLTSDDYGRHIFFVRFWKYKDTSATMEYLDSYVVIFNEDGSVSKPNGIMKIADLWNYQDDLRAFKIRNGWNTG